MLESIPAHGRTSKSTVLGPRSISTRGVPAVPDGLEGGGEDERRKILPNKPHAHKLTIDDLLRTFKIHVLATREDWPATARWSKMELA
eukprot:3920531-Pyramimonas_sp.AAC.1